MRRLFVMSTGLGFVSIPEPASMMNAVTIADSKPAYKYKLLASRLKNLRWPYKGEQTIQIFSPALKKLFVRFTV